MQQQRVRGVSERASDDSLDVIRIRSRRRRRSIQPRDAYGGGGGGVNDRYRAVSVPGLGFDARY